MSEGPEETTYPQSKVVWFCKHSAIMTVDRVAEALMGAAKSAFEDSCDAEAKNYRQAANWVKSCCRISIPAEIEKLRRQWLIDDSKKKGDGHE